MATLTYQWPGSFTNISNLGSNDNDDMSAFFPQTLLLRRIALSNTAGYFHHHQSGQFGVISVRRASDGVWIEVYRQLMPVGDIAFSSINFLVPSDIQRVSINGLRFQSDPAVGQGMHGVASFTVTVEESLSLSIGSSPGAYGTSAYGGSAHVQTPGEEQVESTVSAGASTVTFGMSVARAGATIVVRDSAPAPEDIEVAPSLPEDSFDLAAAGASTVTFGQGTALSSSTYVMAGEGRMADSPLGLVKVEAQAASDGIGGVLANHLLVIKAEDQFVIYQSRPPYEQQDVLMGTNEGPGGIQGFAMVVFAEGGSALNQMGARQSTRARSDGKATGSVNLGVTRAVQSTSAGRAASPFNYLSSRVYYEAVSAGRGGSIMNYIGSRASLALTSAGRGGARDQFGTAGRWYLGSSVRMTATSAGRATMQFYLASRVYVDAMTSAGRGGARDQFGTAGRWYLGSSTRMAATSAGRATVVTYLSTPVRVAAISRGVASCPKNYMSSPVRASAASAGKGGGIIYMGSRVYMAGTSPGRAGGTWRLGGTFLLSNITMRGVGGWVLGPVFQYAHVMKGEGRMANVHLAGTQRISSRSNGVGTMRENTVLLRMTINGSAKGTEFDKPPFAFVVRAGCRGLGAHRLYSQHDPRFNHYRDDTTDHGVEIYLASRNGFANNHPTQHHRGGLGSQPQGPSTMAGASTFTFPYEMVAISNAGCRAFTSYRSNDDPTIFPTNGHSGTPGGVFAKQTSPDYISMLTTGRPDLQWPGAHDEWYMSSRVYQQISPMAGRSTVFFRRIDEMDVFGIGGGSWTMGADNRQMATQSDGVADWSNHYLPDIRLLDIRPRGVAGGRAYQAGNVHFNEGLITSRGIGTFFIDPGLIASRSNGVGRMLDIERPDQVSMRWGSGEFFYEYHFPYIAPLLIPNGSNGMSRVEIEEASTGVIHHHMDGVTTVPDNELFEITSGITNQVCLAGCYEWWDHSNPDPVFYNPNQRHPHGGPNDFLFGHNQQFRRYHKQGVEMAFPVQPVLIAFNGVGEMVDGLTVFYIVRWQNWFNAGVERGDLPYTSNDRNLDENGNPTLAGSGRVGGVGRMLLEGDRRLAGISRGRADIFIKADAKGRFAMDLRARGISTFLNVMGGGAPPLDRYGNMLRYFFIPLPSYGQLWPRKERQHGQPV